MSYHVVIDKRATLLYKSSNSKCEIFNRSLADGPTKFCEPKMLRTILRADVANINAYGAKIKQKQNISGPDQWLLDIALAIIWQNSNIPKKKRKRENLPATPSFSPHCGLVRFVRRKCITVETITRIDLLGVIKSNFKNQFCKTVKIAKYSMLQCTVIIINIRWADIDLILVLQMHPGYALRFSFLITNYTSNITERKHLDKHRKSHS
jgi:hypothetical protein